MTQPAQEPTVGRIVHVAGPNNRCLAAIIEEIPEAVGQIDNSDARILNLVVFYGGAGMTYDVPRHNQPCAEEHPEGTWHWPTQV
jgi:hypothetical protein